MSIINSIILTVASGLVVSGFAITQEHPKSEHPQEQPQAQEHPKEHPISLSTQVVTKDNLAMAIRNHIAVETAKNGGFYLAIDDRSGDTLKLNLKKVHDNKLATLGDQTYFACADFVTPDSIVYDLDFFMVGASVDDLKPTEVTVHKEEGIERYTWLEVEGVWQKVEVDE
ncbi:MAG: hypothetical protein IIA61_11575 [Candidatus Marinimicrobia bacterium]|nr:hypothetical protein [Candidatus Neomarinimicrobiota bacterium]